MADNSEQKPTQTVMAVTTGGFRGRLDVIRRRRYALALAAAVLLGLLALGYVIYKQVNPDVSKEPNYDLSQLPSEPAVMTEAERDLYIRAKTSFTYAELKSMPISGDIFADFDEAYLCAEVLQATGEHTEQSYAAYQIADGMGGNHSEEFHRDYANTAAQLQKGDAYRAQLEKAKAAVQRDGNLSDFDKQGQLTELDQLISLSEGEF